MKQFLKSKKKPDPHTKLLQSDILNVINFQSLARESSSSSFMMEIIMDLKCAYPADQDAGPAQAVVIKFDLATKVAGVNVSGELVSLFPGYLMHVCMTI